MMVKKSEHFAVTRILEVFDIHRVMEACLASLFADVTLKLSRNSKYDEFKHHSTLQLVN